MRTRIALALPLLAVGIACQTSSSQRAETARTASPPASPAASADPRAHSDDRIVTGRIREISPESLTIASEDGTTKTLQLVPETSFLVDGQDAHAADLLEGQPVSASFSTVEDRDVAVEIQAGQGASGSSGSLDGQRHPAHHGAGPAAPGASGAAPSDASGSGSTGTGSSAPDRRY